MAVCEENLVATQFVDVSSGLSGGLPYQLWAAELVKNRKADGGKDDPHARCMPNNVVAMHTEPSLKKFIQTPGLLTILNEYNASYRQVFTDGRPLPVDPNPSWSGYSVGKWDGETLVVETIGLRDGLWLDRAGNPLTDAAKITERYRRINHGNLEVDVTVDDAKAYTKPWTIKLNQFLVPNTDLLDYICLENKKDSKHLVGK